MALPYLGEIRIFTGNFAPDGWAFCDGSALPIPENAALFAIIGTTYGGDGVETFNLPDLRGRVAMHPATDFPVGQIAGTESVTLAAGQLPLHNHTLSTAVAAQAATTHVGSTSAASSNSILAQATDSHRQPVKMYAPSPTTYLAPITPTGTTQSAGGGQPHNNIQPVLAISYIIALQGVFPVSN